MILGTVVQLAADDPALEGRGPEWGKAAPVALLIILLMGIALFLLIRSMNSQLRKVPTAFMRGEQPPIVEPAAGTAPAAASAPPVGTDVDPPDARRPTPS